MEKLKKELSNEHPPIVSSIPKTLVILGVGGLQKRGVCV